MPEVAEVVHVAGPGGIRCARCGADLLGLYPAGSGVVVFSRDGRAVLSWRTGDRPACPRVRFAGRETDEPPRFVTVKRRERR
jgi:hypothetical protein